MKKLFSVIVLLMFLCPFLNAQKVTEPEFVGECVAVNPDSSTIALEKSTIKLQTKSGTSVYLTGIGSVKTKIKVEWAHSPVVLKSNDDFKIIVKAVDNNTDPIAIISVFKFDVSSNSRKAELASVSTFGGSTENKLKRLSYTAKKFGTSSYILTLTQKPIGEYGIIIRNPNNRDEKNVIVSCFSIQ